MRRLLTLVAFLSMALGVAPGQTLGGITGVVTDPSGAVIPGASVVVTNTATNAARSTTTNTDGLYVFPDLVPGTYNVKASAPGFNTVVKQNIVLQVQQTERIDFKLEVGQATQTVEVAANAALLSTENATVGTVIEEQRIMDLPLNGRSYFSLVALSSQRDYRICTRRAGGRPSGRLARRSHHRRDWRARDVGKLHPGRHHQHRHRLQYLYPAAIGRCPTGIQGPVRDLSRGVRPGTWAGQRRHQTRHQ